MEGQASSPLLPYLSNVQSRALVPTLSSYLKNSDTLDVALALPG